MKGFGTDEKAIINVLARRSNSQRQDIALQFKTLFGKVWMSVFIACYKVLCAANWHFHFYFQDLISDLKSELGGKFEDLVLALMKPHFEFMAKELHDAISGIGTDEETVVEVICSSTNQEIHAIKAAYHHSKLHLKLKYFISF